MSLIMKTLTNRQKEILDLIKSYILDYGFPPTRAEISKILGFKSANAAEQHLRAIEKKGYIQILSLIHISEPTRPERMGDGGLWV